MEGKSLYQSKGERGVDECMVGVTEKVVPCEETGFDYTYIGKGRGGGGDDNNFPCNDNNNPSVRQFFFSFCLNHTFPPVTPRIDQRKIEARPKRINGISCLSLHLEDEHCTSISDRLVSGRRKKKREKGEGGGQKQIEGQEQEENEEEEKVMV